MGRKSQSSQSALLLPLEQLPAEFLCNDREFELLSERRDRGELVIVGYSRKGGLWTVTVSYDTRAYDPYPLSLVKVPDSMILHWPSPVQLELLSEGELFPNLDSACAL